MANKPTTLPRNEIVQAANALIEWFNHQEIQSHDAELIMLKVQAKLVVSRIRTENDVSTRLDFEVHDHMRLLSIEIINRVHQTRKDRT